MRNVPSRFSELLPGWTIDREAVAVPGEWTWQDGRGARIGRHLADIVVIEFEHILRVAVDVSRCRLVTEHLEPNLDDATLEHLLLDQLVPRIRAHLGETIIHAAAVSRNERALLLVGDSGQGKSTLSASLAAHGCTLLGDDAVSLASDAAGGGVMVRALYPSLRLLPDSVAALIGSDVPTSPTAHYTVKQRVAAGSGGPEAPCAAIFVLENGVEGSDDVLIRPLTPSATCLALVKEGFLLDPGDTAVAAARLAEVGKVAERVPGYSLHYPREYERLPQVVAAVLGQAGMSE